MAPQRFWPAFLDQERPDWPEWAKEFLASIIDIMEVYMAEMAAAAADRTAAS